MSIDCLSETTSQKGTTEQHFELLHRILKCILNPVRFVILNLNTEHRPSSIVKLITLAEKLSKVLTLLSFLSKLFSIEFFPSEPLLHFISLLKRSNVVITQCYLLQKPISYFYILRTIRVKSYKISEQQNKCLIILLNIGGTFKITYIQFEFNHLMEEQLQAEIKKNKNLIQSNFTLMEEIEQYTSALGDLKRYFKTLSNEDESFEQAVSADEAAELVANTIKLIQQRDSKDKKMQRNEKFENDGQKKCECDKWKELYTNESEQSLRLSKKVVQLEFKINTLESKQELERKEMDEILKKYLLLFQKVHSVQFLNQQTQQTIIKKGKQSSESKEKLRSSHEKDKRNNSGNKSKNAKTNAKKPKLTEIQQNTPASNHIPSNISDDLSFPLFLKYLQNVRQDFNNSLLENRLLREELSDSETIIKLYRQKQRQRLLFNKFAVH